MEYRPVGKLDNALQQVAFVIEYKDPFQQSELMAIDACRKEWMGRLPRRSVSRGFVVQPQSGSVNIDQQSIVGLSYEYLKADGSIQNGMRIEQNRIPYVIGDYSRWDKIWPDAKLSLDSVMGCLSTERTIISYSSEYTDRFHGVGNYVEFDPSEIFRSNSPYLSPHILTRKQNWHSHTGYFEHGLEADNYRILTRINTDLIYNIEENAREVRLLLFHSIRGMTKPFSEDSDPLPVEIIDRGLQNFTFLHDLDKKRSCVKSLRRKWQLQSDCNEYGQHNEREG